MTALAVRDLGVRFGGIAAVSGLDFEVEPQEVFGIIGPNGAGKTTTFNLLSRLYEPTSGSIVLDGRELVGMRPHQVARLGLARTFQNIEVFGKATVLENLMGGAPAPPRGNALADLLFLPAVRRRERESMHRAETVIEFLELEGYRNQHVEHLPYGVRKLVELGRALCASPRVLLLDEPCSGLNPEERRDMVFSIRDIRTLLKVTVVLIEHDMTVVSSVCDRVLVLNHGQRLSHGTPAQVQADPAVVAAYLG